MNNVDIVEQIALISRDAVHEFQAFLVEACCVVLACCVVGLAARRLRGAFRRAIRLVRGMDGVARAVAVLFLAVATIYGGAKRVANAGSDDTIALEGVYVLFTNDLTTVEVKFTGDGVTASTPVAVRMSETNEWEILTKISPILITDASPKVLTFDVAGDFSALAYWWVGDDRPSIVIETQGIVITRFVATSTSVVVEFTCDDPNATNFDLQTRVVGELNWDTVGSVVRSDQMAFSYSGFTVGKTREWRVRAEYTMGEE